MMTKRLVWFVWCLIGMVQANAQTKVSYRLGVTAGVNAAQLQQSSVRSHLLWRYNAGVALTQQISPRFGIAYELHYSRQGSSTPVTGTGGDDKVITAFDYVNLPVLFRYQPRSERGFIEVGGQGGYLLSGKGYFNSTPNQASRFSHTNKVDGGLIVGVGTRLGTHLVVDARYYHGLNQILTNYSAPDPITGVSTYYQVVKWYNRVWSLNLACFF
jgi:hypothetical protein